MRDNIYFVVKDGDRIEEKNKNCQQKKSFVKHMDWYFEKIRRCHTNLQVLKEIHKNWESYSNAYSFSPAFWAAVEYDIQMSLVIELNSFISKKKTDESLLLYIDKVITNHDQIYNRRFFITLKNRAGETREEERVPCYDTLTMLYKCKNDLESLLNNYPMLKKARNKVYAHIDKSTMTFEDCNKKYLNNINFDNITVIIDTISTCLLKIYSAYTNVQYPVDYLNKDDVKNIFNILETYKKYTKEILELKRNKLN